MRREQHSEMVPTTYTISQEPPLQGVQSDFAGRVAVPLTHMLCLTPGWVLPLSDPREQGPGSGGCVAAHWFMWIWLLHLQGEQSPPVPTWGAPYGCTRQICKYKVKRKMFTWPSEKGRAFIEVSNPLFWIFTSSLHVNVVCSLEMLTWGWHLW